MRERATQTLTALCLVAGLALLTGAAAHPGPALLALQGAIGLLFLALAGSLASLEPSTRTRGRQARPRPGCYARRDHRALALALNLPPRDGA